MRLPAGSTGEARDSLFRLMSERALAPLPLATVAKAGAAITLRLGPDTGAAGRPVDLVVEHEGRGTETIRIAPDAVRTAWTALPDGRSVRLREIDLPPQPPGRHVVRLADRADLSGQLVVARGRAICRPRSPTADGGSASPRTSIRCRASATRGSAISPRSARSDGSRRRRCRRAGASIRSTRCSNTIGIAPAPITPATAASSNRSTST